MINTNNLLVQTNAKIASLTGAETNAELLAISVAANSLNADRSALDTIIQSRIDGLSGDTPSKQLIALARSATETSSSSPSMLVPKSTYKSTSSLSSHGLLYTQITPTYDWKPMVSISGSGIFRFAMLHATGTQTLACRIFKDDDLLVDTTATPKTFSSTTGQVFVGNFYLDFAVNASSTFNSYDTRIGGYLSTDAIEFKNQWLIEVKKTQGYTADARLSYDYSLT